MALMKALPAAATALRSQLAAQFGSLLTSPGEPGPVLAAVDRLEASPQADALLPPLRRAVHRIPDAPRDALHGRWLGHPAHPAMVQLPLAAWFSAAALDLLPGNRRTAGALVAAGLATAGPAAIAGWADWADLRRPQQRVGLVHAAANSVGVALYAGSLAARLRGRGLRGRLLGFAGLTAVGAGGALGGHLAYRQAAGVNHAEQVPAVVEPGWHPLGALAEFPVGSPVRRAVGEVPVVVVREADGELRALADRCAHQAGPLSEGEVVDGCLRCPWHGSMFRLADGWNVRGPATSPQPSFECRVTDGQVEARYRTPVDESGG